VFASSGSVGAILTSYSVCRFGVSPKWPIIVGSVTVSLHDRAAAPKHDGNGYGDPEFGVEATVGDGKVSPAWHMGVYLRLLLTAASGLRDVLRCEHGDCREGDQQGYEDKHMLRRSSCIDVIINPHTM
jgi:hypothetical protein